ncbi:unnamed protein product [Parnassius apollo]|uniref:(apollo) hypothetical protein n=1 Tax=Parnassius apollo TaxID=110799 RepID=A0A8S3YEX5_PARAO|nr:unnamed protein product [Parnassius apollo]
MKRKFIRTFGAGSGPRRSAQQSGELAARDALVQSLRDRDHENRATIDLQRKEQKSNADVVRQMLTEDTKCTHWQKGYVV